MRGYFPVEQYVKRDILDKCYVCEADPGFCCFNPRYSMDENRWFVHPVELHLVPRWSNEGN